MLSFSFPASEKCALHVTNPHKIPSQLTWEFEHGIIYSVEPFLSWFVDKLLTSIKYVRICLQNSVFLRKQGMTAGSAIMSSVGSQPALAVFSATGIQGSACSIILTYKKFSSCRNCLYPENFWGS